MEIGKKYKFFHPGTFGVMLPGKLKKINENGTVVVEFDQPFPNSNKRTFTVPPDHIELKY